MARKTGEAPKSAGEGRKPAVRARRSGAQSASPSEARRPGPAAAGEGGGWETAGGVALKTPVRPVSKAIAILRYLNDGRSSTAAQIARDLHINASTCYNILRTLVAEDILNFESSGKTYKRGAGLLALTAGMMSQEARIMAARERIAEFARTFNATICLWERVSVDRNILVATEHGSGNVRIYLRVHDRFPALLGSTGRLLATRLGLSKAEVKRRYAQAEWFNRPDFEQYWAEAVEAASNGYAVDDGNFSAGVLTVSVPVVDGAGKIIYSITALTFRELIRGRELKKLIANLKKLSEDVSRVLY